MEIRNFENTKLRPVWDPLTDRECNVPYCNVQITTFAKYIQHWSEIHVKKIMVYVCIACTQRLEKRERAMQHASVVHRKERDENNIENIEVNNYKYKSDYGTLPYRKGTALERKAIYEREKRKAQEERKLLKKKVEEDRGFI
ncbi:Hypothetical predicted protein [Mytilus galloprovincialis]|uniref:C2H2-type domain-containing protein n=1 Tax=Mytilus galloprovincialis TaxID=29158 RepID=A0A8B6HBG9_MYTGA|nr:Hypothetical predicted protein [Mytilus galloprovincialis]